MMIINVVKVFLPSIIAFGLGIFLTPLLTHFLYKHKMWKKKAGKVDLQGNATPIFNSLHKEREVSTPRMGGIIIWASATITILGFWLVDQIFSNSLTNKIDFLSRNQTWLPLSVLLFGSLVGLVDDYLEISGSATGKSGGLSLKKRLLMVSGVALLCALWFYFKLGISYIGIPHHLSFELGWLFIPFFILVTLAIYSGGVIDGIDGLAGGIFATIFAAYAGIAFFENQINLAAFCALLAGSILAFLWFNIPPARYYMSETGSMGLTITLAIIAFLTDAHAGGYGVLVLPIIALPLIVTTLSNIIQVLSKKFRGKKVFLVAPLHHHFEAIGWPAYKVTMRYWVLGVIFALLGMIIAFVA